MENVVKEYKFDKTVLIVEDPDPLNPRKCDDNLGIMVCGHRRYSLGDVSPANTQRYSSWEEWLQYEVIKPNGGEKNVVYLPLYLLDHGNLAINTTGFVHCDPQGWDWAQVGYIYTTRDSILTYFGKKRLTEKLREQARKILESEVEAYNDYLCGEHYGVVIKDKDDDVIDSCYGFTSIEEAVKYIKSLVTKSVSLEL